VLIVSQRDDENRMEVAEQLAGAGFWVEWASDAQEGRAIVARCAPDLVVVEHAADAAASDDVVQDIAGGESAQWVVVTINRPHVRPSQERRITIVPRRDSGPELGDLVAAIVRAMSVGS
jgi:DNA-binding response OmpR family regulator